MYISKLVLNPMNYYARQNFSSPYEMHRTLCKMFDEVKRPHILFRIEHLSRKSTEMAVIMQSGEVPDHKKIEENYLLDILIKELPDDELFDVFFKKGIYQFRLAANPVKKQGNRKIGLYKEDEQKRWMERKALQGGFQPSLQNIFSFTIGNKKYTENKENKEKIQKKKKNIYILGVRYDGILKISEPETFFNTFKNGIGSSKSFGFGLLSLKKME